MRTHACLRTPTHPHTAAHPLPASPHSSHPPGHQDAAACARATWSRSCPHAQPGGASRAHMRHSLRTRQSTATGGPGACQKVQAVRAASDDGVCAGAAARQVQVVQARQRAEQKGRVCSDLLGAWAAQEMLGQWLPRRRGPKGWWLEAAGEGKAGWMGCGSPGWRTTRVQV
jgi:hypothetical protein